MQSRESDPVVMLARATVTVFAIMVGILIAVYLLSK